MMLLIFISSGIDQTEATELSDMYRPTKLGEMYMQLYEDEWLEALERLTGQGQTERQAIKTLEKTLMVN